MPLSILVIEDEISPRELMRDFLTSEGHRCDVSDCAQSARSILEAFPRYQLVVSDLRMPDKKGDLPSFETGFALVKHMATSFPQLYIMVLTASDRIEYAVRAIQSGARDYLVKGCDTDVLKEKLSQIDRLMSLRDENLQLKHGKDFGRPIGKSREFNEMFKIIRKVAPTNVAVLIQGETGTGKELVAQALHKDSGRVGDFVSVDCASISKTLFESELFGHEKGAFTDAKELKIGKIELADGGTIFLDEIGEMPHDIQSKFLRVLQEKTFMRVGGNKNIHVDFRVVAATNRDLREMAGNGTFREDLLYRLNTITINVPSLNERRTDIPLLAKYFAGKVAENNGELYQRDFSSSALEQLTNHNWSGNIRQLRNVIERSCILASEKNVLDVEDILFDARASSTSISSLDDLFSLPLRQAEDEFEKKYLENTLKLYKKKIQASDFANIDKSNFIKLLKKHGLSQ